LPADEEVWRIGRSTADDAQLDLNVPSPSFAHCRLDEAHRLLICSGLLTSKHLLEQSDDEILASIRINLVSVTLLIEHALKINPDIRICVIGSESGWKGSFDTTYFLGKAALHSFIRERRVSHANQQLVGIAPSMISDSRMTTIRTDQDVVQQRGRENPKERLLTSDEVASLAHFMLYIDQGYINNTVVPMDGGKFARMRVDPQ
jgi:short-subunit dehydrogenase